MEDEDDGEVVRTSSYVFGDTCDDGEVVRTSSGSAPATVSHLLITTTADDVVFTFAIHCSSCPWLCSCCSCFMLVAMRVFMQSSRSHHVVIM